MSRVSEATAKVSVPTTIIAADATSGHRQDWSKMMRNLQDERTAVADFERHIEEVRDYVPDHRLLVYEVARGWQPLCEFLG